MSVKTYAVWHKAPDAREERCVETFIADEDSSVLDAMGAYYAGQYPDGNVWIDEYRDPMSMYLVA